MFESSASAGFHLEVGGEERMGG
jgi:hypothetical protein